MTASTESRLTAALHARADLLGPGDLTPAAPPAGVVPLHRRRALVGTAAAIGLAAAAVVVAGALSGGDPARGTRGLDVTTSTATPDSLVTPGPPRSGGMLEQDVPFLHGPGEVATYHGTGWTASVSADSRTLTVTAAGTGESFTTGLPAAPDGVTTWVSGVDLELGPAGTGWLVEQGDGEWARLSVAVVRDGRLVLAAPTGDVPLGRGFTQDGTPYLSWTSQQGAALRTGVLVGSPDEQTYDVHRWRVETSGAGSTVLVPEPEGRFCFDHVDVPPTYRTC